MGIFTGIFGAQNNIFTDPADETITTTDRIIVVNEGEAGAGVTGDTAGLRVDRGSSTDAELFYDDSVDQWQIGIQGSLKLVASTTAITEGYIPFGTTGGGSLTEDDGLFWDNSNKRLGIEQTTPSYPLDVTGIISSTSDIRLGGDLVSTATDGFDVTSALTAASGGVAFDFNSTNTLSGADVLFKVSNNTSAKFTVDNAGNGTFGGNVDAVNGVLTGTLTVNTNDLYVASNQVGVNTVSPDGTLHVHTATAGAVTASATGDDLVIENNATGGISILTPNTASGTINFGDPEDNDVGAISYGHTTDVLSFKAAGATVGSWGASGLVLASGATINEFSTDGTLAGNSDTALPTEKAVKTYVDGAVATPAAHAASHTNGTDDIQDATAAQKGLMTVAYASKLDGIEAGAQANEVTAVANGADNRIATFSSATALNGETSLTWDGTKLGVGTSAPDGTAHVMTASAGVVTASATGDDLVVENNATGGITILTPNTASGVINFGDPDDNDVGAISYGHSTDLLAFKAAGATVGTWGSSGLTLASGATVNEFSTDGTLAGNSDTAVPTEQAVKTYVDTVGGGAVSSVANGADNRIATFSSADALNGEANITFDGSSLGVGIDATLAEGTVHIHTGSAGSVAADIGADDLVVENSATGGITIVTPAASDGILAFGNPNNKLSGIIKYVGSTDTLEFGAGAIDNRMNLTSSGLKLVNGTRINEFSTDGTLSGDSDLAVPTEKAVKAYALANVVEDTTPQLGGMLDVNGNSIGDGSAELLKFSETPAAVNEFTIANAATLSGPTLSATGGDVNIDINISAKGTGNISLGNYTFDGDQTVGAGQDNYVLTYDNGTGNISLEAASGGIADVVDDITPQLGGDLDVNGNKITSASNGDIEITPNGTGSVGIGISTPDGLVHIHSGSAGTVTAGAAGDELVLEGDLNCGMSILSAATGNGIIYFGSPDNNIEGAIYYDHPDAALTFKTNNTEACHITSSQHFMPAVTETSNLGSATFEWNNLYVQNSPTVSDARRKNSIEAIDYAEALLSNLNPVQFKYNDTVIPATEESPERVITHTRPHTGFIAQEVKDAMNAAGIEDWAGYAYEEDSDTHLIRLNEFIGVLVAGYKALEARVAQLESN